jgi:hypothetical protein
MNRPDATEFAEPAGPESERRKRRLKELSERVVQELSETILYSARQVATESDVWFVAAVKRVDRGVRRTRNAVGQFGRYVVAKSSKLSPRWLRKKSHRERIRAMLIREAKRSNVKLSGQEFDQFSERIATLLELVLQGSVSVADIAFEQDERTRLLDRALTSTPGANPESAR